MHSQQSAATLHERIATRVSGCPYPFFCIAEHGNSLAIRYRRQKDFLELTATSMKVVPEYMRLAVRLKFGIFRFTAE